MKNKNMETDQLPIWQYLKTEDFGQDKMSGVKDATKLENWSYCFEYIQPTNVCMEMDTWFPIIRKKFKT